MHELPQSQSGDKQKGILFSWLHINMIYTLYILYKIYIIYIYHIYIFCTSIYTYIYICVCIYIHICVCIYIYIYTYMCVYIYIYMGILLKFRPKRTLFWKKGNKNFTTYYSIPFLSVLHQNKALYNFNKRQRGALYDCSMHRRSSLD